MMDLDVVQGMTEVKRMRRRAVRPYMVDCRGCGGVGLDGYNEYCWACGGTGLDAIPWRELISYFSDCVTV